MGFALSTMKLTSSAFENDGAIPKQHTGEGQDVSPALRWTDAPAGAKSFAVICHDPDAPLIKGNTYGYVHWVLYNLPPVTTLAEGTREGTLGINDFGKASYNGPLPPPGHGTHHYYFWILALDTDAKLPPGLSLWQLLEKIEPDVIAMNRLVGTYQR
jgi:Raf kinase inhibitor-like YbhB/YbcL family protein